MAMRADAEHCSFVLLADFDIDRGAQLTYQFPQPLGTDEGYAVFAFRLARWIEEVRQIAGQLDAPGRCGKAARGLDYLLP